MTDKPIIFSGPMVRALLDGRKTQTRRPLKQQPVARDVRANGFFGVTNTFSFTLCDDGGANSTMAVPVGYQVGDRLWVREAHYLTDDGDAEAVVYAEDADASEAHRNEVLDMQRRYNLKAEWAKPHLRKRPSIHMPRWASRLTLTVTDVRVQRLQDISEADAVDEGVQPNGKGATPRNQFCALWNNIHGPDAWGANPWVCALTFTVHRGNIDTMGGGA